MNTLAGWGFRTPEALERHCNPPPVQEQRTRRFKTGRWVGSEEIEAYAATLKEIPTAQEVQRHFNCGRDSSYRYRTRVMDVLARKARGEA